MFKTTIFTIKTLKTTLKASIFYQDINGINILVTLSNWNDDMPKRSKNDFEIFYGAVIFNIN